MKLIGAWAAVVLLLVAGSCISKKKGLSSREMTLYHQHDSESQTAHRAVHVEQYGDTLRGRVPLPFQIPATIPGVSGKPLVIPVSSSGLDLEIRVDSTGLSYRAVAKPVARMQVQETESYSRAVAQSEAVLKEETKTKEVKQGIPWWLILIGVLLILVTLGWQVFKNKLKPF